MPRLRRGGALWLWSAGQDDRLAGLPEADRVVLPHAPTGRQLIARRRVAGGTEYKVMPIRSENSTRYPANWQDIRKTILHRADNHCEGCGAANGKPHPITGSLVVLTIAHLDHTPENCDPDNLRAWCQKCHNSYDAKNRRAGIRSRARQAFNVPELFDGKDA